MRLDVITIFPEIFGGWESHSLVGKARENGQLSWHVHDLKSFSGRQDGRVDDRPYGGGPGMVLRAQPVLEALESISGYEQARRIHLSPAGRLWGQPQAVEMSQEDHVILLCSRYEGVDERALTLGQFEEISIGNYVVMGGEVPAMVLMESILRLVPGVVGCENSVLEDSFSPSRRGLLDCPHYTRPEIFRGHSVPQVLLSGHHAQVESWRQQQGHDRTRQRRPDLCGDAS